MRRGNYDRLARSYGFWTRLAFGGTLQKAQGVFFGGIGKDLDILVLGPGRGEVLPELLESCEPRSLQLVEPSAKMMAHLRAKLNGYPQVIFTEEAFPSPGVSGQKDLIICPFFLDLFSAEDLREVLAEIRKRLKADGQLWVVDFAKPTNWWQGAYEGAMRTFINRATDSRVPRIQEIENEVRQAGFQIQDRRSHFGNFVFSSLWIRDFTYDSTQGEKASQG